MTAGELLVKLGFEVDTLKLNEFIKDLGELNLSSVLAAAGIGGMIKGLQEVLSTADALTASLNKLTGITGVQPQVFQAWETAAKQFNVTAGVSSSTIEDIQKHLGQVKFGDPFALRLQSLFPGVKVLGRENNPQGVLRDILAVGEKMTLNDERDLLIKAGLNVELLNYRGHLNDIDSELTNTTSDFGKLNDFHQKINKLSSDWGKLLVAVGGALTPILDPLLEILDALVSGITKMISIMPEWIKDLAAVAIIWGTIYGTIRAVIVALGVLSGLSAIKALAPFLSAVAPFLARSLPVVGGAIAVGGAAFSLWDLLKPKDQTSNSVNNGGDVSVNNTYQISSNDPYGVAKEIKDYQESQMRDTQGQARLGWI